MSAHRYDLSCYKYLREKMYKFHFNRYLFLTIAVIFFCRGLCPKGNLKNYMIRDGPGNAAVSHEIANSAIISISVSAGFFLCNNYDILDMQFLYRISQER